MSSRGNILFIILIAVALFAALSYAITSSSRSNSSNIGTDKAKLKAAEILQYAEQIRSAMTKIKLLNRCNYNAIDYNIVFGAPASNDNPCNVWGTQGGNVPYGKYGVLGADNADTKGIYIDTYPNQFPNRSNRITNTNTVQDIGLRGGREILFKLYHIKPEICEGINALAKVKGDIMQEQLVCHGCGWNNPTHTGTNSNFMIGDTAGAPNLAGKLFGCYKAEGAANFLSYHAFFVLEEN